MINSFAKQKKNISHSEKVSLLSRLFRRSGRSKQRQIETYSAQFPPAEWFNSKAVHLHSVGTQTSDLVSNADIKSDEVCFGKFGEIQLIVHTIQLI